MNVPIEYEQTDSRWRNIMYSPIGNHNDTIGNSGCGPTCAAMVVATLRDRSVTPLEAARWALAKGYVSPYDGTYWGFFKAYLAANGIDCKQLTKAEADQAIAALRKDRMVITSMGRGNWTTVGHFILAYGIQNDRVKIHDPNSESPYRELGNLTAYKTEAAQFWIIPEVWKVNISTLKVKDLDNEKEIGVSAVNIDGTNFVKFRDFEKLANIKVGNEGATPTIQGGGKEDMSGEEIYMALQTYLKDVKLPDWAKKEMEEAKAMGITDGTNPMQLIPRYQAAIMAKRAKSK